MGCLTAPFRLFGCAVLLAALAAGWFFRDRIVARVTHLFGVHRPVAGAVGRPGVRALESARSKIDSLNGWRADSVVLTPSELASLIGAGLAPELRGQLDSLQVFAADGALGVRARLKTAHLPADLVGPLAIALRPTEPVEAAGPVSVPRAGTAEWTVRSFSIRDIPIPERLMPALVARAFGNTTRRTVPVRIPAGIRRIRLRPSGATLYGVPSP